MRNVEAFSLKMNSWKSVLWAALIVRLVAVFLSQGYGMHDDHFLIVEAASSWADGYDYNNWLPWSPNNAGHPEGHSFTYVGVNFIYFYFMKMIGVVNPKLLMFFNRLIHALASIAVVHFGMRITEKLSDRKTAILVGYFLALLWIMPFISVRNLVEMAAAPLLVYGVWIMLKKKTFFHFFVSGLMIGLSVSFRYQIGVFSLGLGLYFLVRREWISLVAFTLGNVLVFSFTQGLIDYLVWGYPFAEFQGYVTYNLKEGTHYLPNQNYLMYLLVLMGCFFVPMGFVLGYGFFRSANRFAILFVPTFAFLLFHTIFPNRQERFILTILPFFVILGILGYQLVKDNVLKDRLWKISIRIFWVINIPFLLFACTMYSKRSRVEAMYALYAKKDKIDLILLEASASGHVSMLPKFYSKKWLITQIERTDSRQDLRVNPELNCQYIFFFDDLQLNKRIAQYKKIYPNMVLEFKSYPSMVDELLRELNPRNANEYIEVWKTNFQTKNSD
jgi:hypothetical protein